MNAENTKLSRLSDEPQKDRAAVKERARHFQYLDRLRESGKTNMYGSSTYLEAAFGIKRDASIKIVSSWMSTFSDAPAIDRARIAMKDA